LIKIKEEEKKPEHVLVDPPQEQPVDGGRRQWAVKGGRWAARAARFFVLLQLAVAALFDVPPVPGFF
jgi:hypothetical protein